MKVKLVTIKERREFEIAFPLYRRHAYDDDASGSTTTHFEKIVETAKGYPLLLELVEHVGDNEAWEIRTERFQVHPDESVDYALGLGAHTLTAEEWEEARRRFQHWATDRGFARGRVGEVV